MLHGKLSGAETVDLRERWPIEVMHTTLCPFSFSCSFAKASCSQVFFSYDNEQINVPITRRRNGPAIL